MQILGYTLLVKDLEIYILLILFFFTIWYIVDTFHYAKGEKRKVKNLHRFAKEGEKDAQKDLAKCYEKGYVVKQNSRIAAYWRQLASFDDKHQSKKQNNTLSSLFKSIISTIKKLF